MEYDKKSFSFGKNWKKSYNKKNNDILKRKPKKDLEGVLLGEISEKHL